MGYYGLTAKEHKERKKRTDEQAAFHLIFFSDKSGLNDPSS